MEAESVGGASATTAQEGWLLIRVNVPELNVQKNLQFPKDQLVWDVKQQCLAALPKELKESFNYGLFCPPINGKAGKFLDEERRLGDYPFNGPVGYLELKYKRRVYKMLKLDEKQLKAVHTRANLRRFLDYVAHGQVEKITKMCAKGLDPNFHCQETGETPLTMATTIKKPSKILIGLVNGGALLDYRTRDGSTAMHRAVEKDSLEGVKTLLELGASSNYKDGKGLTPLYLSVTNKTDPLICETLLHDHGTIGAQDLQGWQEVHQACRNGLVQHLEHLVAYGADLEARNASGNTPLHVCAVNGQRAAARLLLFRGASKDALNFAGQTPYQVAVIAGDLELAESINSYKSEDVVLYRGPPHYNPRRRSGIILGSGGSWSCGIPGDRSSMASTLTRIPCELEAMLRSVNGPPSPCPYERSFSSASSSLSEGSHPEDNASIVTDKSLGDASDIISDSSGVGTSNSDTTTCSISLPGTTVVCLESYDSGVSGHLRICQGDIIEVTGASDCGLLEGQVRGTNVCGLFPPRCVHEVRLRHANAVPVLPVLPTAYTITANDSPRVTGRRENVTKNYSATAPRLKKTNNSIECRTVVLHRGRRGFGFILRGAKATSPLMELQPSERCPALQYLDDVDKGGAADMVGLRKGDFLIAINGEDVSTASHEKVVELIRASGTLVSMTVVSSWNPLTSNTSTGVPPSRSVASLVSQGAGAPRPFATLPRKTGAGGMGNGGRSPAPAPPRRDPRTTLSVGRARAKSMVAGLENGGEKEEGSEHLNAAKSTSAESIQQQNSHGGLVGAVNSILTGVDTGTPPSARTASIRARPASSRITAAELEELFQRQQGHSKGSAMMITSAFQEGCVSSPPFSPAKTKHNRVYTSVAEMKRSKGRSWSRALRQRSSGELKRQFHSTPDLAATPTPASLPVVPSLAYQRQKFRSQDDMHALYSASLPPPLHPPPPVPLDGGVEVAVASSADRSSAVQQPATAAVPPMSSFRPADSAKLYAAPQAAAPVAYRTKSDSRPPVRKTQSLRMNSTASGPPTRQMSVGDSSPISNSQTSPQPQYAQPFKSCRGSAFLARQNSCSGPPPIPEPDYSMSESEDEVDIQKGNHSINAQQNLIETSANSNASGSSSGSGSMHHSFSVEEIQKIKTQLKSSKSYPNDFALQEEKQMNEGHNDDGDNSSSGVSSDQELTIQQDSIVGKMHNNLLGDVPHLKSYKNIIERPLLRPEPTRAKEKVSFSSNVTVKSSNNVITTEPVQLHSSSESISSSGVQSNNCHTEVTHVIAGRYQTISTPSGHVNTVNTSLPLGGTLQRHNSLTRKQAASYLLKREPRSGQSAAERLGVNPSKSPLGKKNLSDGERSKGGALTRNAVSLAQLPPPPEEGAIFATTDFDIHSTLNADVERDVPPLAPPPQFSDKVRIVGAVPKQGSRV